MENRDFKYLMQDITHVYFGRELTYDDLFEMEETPFKLKAIINNYFAKDTEKSRRVLDHLITMSKDEFSYQVYNQLKLQIKVNFLKEKKTIFGMQEKHESVNTTLDEFLTNYKSMVVEGTAFVEEFSISKLALMAVGI